MKKSDSVYIYVVKSLNDRFNVINRIGQIIFFTIFLRTAAYVARSLYYPNVFLLKINEKLLFFVDESRKICSCFSDGILKIIK